eukprot:gene10137-11022_t
MSDSSSQEIFLSLLHEANNYAENLQDPQAKERFHLKCMVHLAKLKTLNRNIHKSIDEERKKLEGKKTDLEKLQLNYENLIYKKNYLLREIHQCRDITTPHLQQIEEERCAPIGTLVYEENLFPDLHEAALRELQEEKEQRRAMEEEYQQRQQLYTEKMEELEKRRKFLEDLPKKVAGIRAATNDLAKELGEYLSEGDAMTATATPVNVKEASNEGEDETAKMEVVNE